LGLASLAYPLPPITSKAVPSDHMVPGLQLAPTTAMDVLCKRDDSMSEEYLRLKARRFLSIEFLCMYNLNLSFTLGQHSGTHGGGACG
jgi:hypothetical protein